MAWVLCLILAGLLAATLVATFHVIDQLRRDVDNAKAEHEACHVAVETALSTANKRVDATILNAAADAWDSVESQQDRIRIANTIYVEGGPSVPTLWLRERAEGMYS